MAIDWSNATLVEEDDGGAGVVGAAPAPAQSDGAPATGPIDWSQAERVEPRSALGEIGSQFKAGALVEVPRTAGQFLQYASEPGDLAYETGKGWADAAKERGDLPEYQPHPEEHGTVVNALAGGARMIPPSLAGPALVGGALAALPVELPALAGLGVAAGLGTLPVAFSQGQETLDSLREQGIPEEDARAAARRTAAIEWGGETIGTMAAGKLLGIGARALSNAGSRGAAALAGATAPALIKPFAKQLGATAVTEVATEMGQAAGQTAVEQAYGGAGPSPWEAAKDVIAPTVGMTVLLAPLGLAGFVSHNRAVEKRAAVLASAQTDPGARAEIASAIAQEIAPHDAAAAAAFHANAMADIQAGAPISLGPSLLAPRAAGAVGGTAAGTAAGVPPPNPPPSDRGGQEGAPGATEATEGVGLADLDPEQQRHMLGTGAHGTLTAAAAAGGLPAPANQSTPAEPGRRSRGELSPLGAQEAERARADIAAEQVRTAELAARGPLSRAAGSAAPDVLAAAAAPALGEAPGAAVVDNGTPIGERQPEKALIDERQQAPPVDMTRTYGPDPYGAEGSHRGAPAAAAAGPPLGALPDMPDAGRQATSGTSGTSEIPGEQPSQASQRSQPSAPSAPSGPSAQPDLLSATTAPALGEVGIEDTIGADGRAGAIPAGAVDPAVGPLDQAAHQALPAGPSPAASQLDQAANEAATSPLNDLPEPSEAMEKAGNYRHGHLRYSGLDISIENPRGSKRSGVDPNGKPWQIEMSAHYGYLKRSEGADGEQVNVYLASEREDTPAFVVDQVDPKTGRFDEHKAVLGAASLGEAEQLYDAHFSDGSGATRRAAVTELPMEGFKAWLKEGNTKKPIAGQKLGPVTASQEARARQLPRGTVIGGADEIGSVFDAVVNQKPSLAKRAVRFAAVDEGRAATIKQKTGLDVAGYEHSIDNFAIRHALKEHGDPAQEASRGQEAITREDFMRVLDIVENHDTLESAGQDAKGAPLIRYTKRYDGMTYYVEEVRTKREELAFKTLWKTRTTKTDAALARPPLLTSETLGRNLSQGEGSVPPETPRDKPADLANPNPEIGSSRVGEPDQTGPQDLQSAPRPEEGEADEDINRFFDAGTAQGGRRAELGDSRGQVGAAPEAGPAGPAALDGEIAPLEGSTADLGDREQAKLAPAELGAPEPQAQGTPTTASTPKGQAVDLHYALVEAADLVASHDLEGKPNPAYPKHLQPRDRSRQASTLQIQRIAGNLAPERLTASPTVSEGAPVVGPDQAVESGNGRVLAIRKAYTGEKGKAYREHLRKNAGQFGVDAAALDTMAEPVLVRVRATKMSDAERAAFARDSNESTTARMSPAEEARADAARVGTALEDYLPSEDGNVLAMQNRGFVKRFLGGLAPEEAAALTTADGAPTKQLGDRIRAAVFFAAYRDERLLSLFAEEADPEIRNVIAALNRAAPEFARARGLSDTLGPYNVIPAIVEAADIIRQARQVNQAVEEAVAQQALFGAQDPNAQAIALFMEQNKRSPKRLGEGMRAMAGFIEKELAKAQNVSLFAETPPTLGEVIARVNQYIQERYGQENAIDQDLFSQPRRDAPVAEPRAESGKPEEGDRAGAEGAEEAKRVTPAYGAANKVFTADAAAAARERLRKKLGTVRIGLDPEMFQDGITLAGYHIEAGARKFGDFSKAMIADLGEAARPYLRKWYNAVKDNQGFDFGAGAAPHAPTEAEVDAMVAKDLAAKEEDENRPGRIEHMVVEKAKRELAAGRIDQAAYDRVIKTYGAAASEYASEAPKEKVSKPAGEEPPAKPPATPPPTPVAKPAPKPAEPAAKPTKAIDDVGEKIGGARKELWAGRALGHQDIAGMNERELGKFVTKEHVFPRPNYQAIADHVNAEFGDRFDAAKQRFSEEVRELDMGAGSALLIKQIRDSIQNPPLGASREQLEDYLTAIGMVRKALEDLQSFIVPTGSNLVKLAFGEGIVTNERYQIWNPQSPNYKYLKALGNKFARTAQVDARDWARAVLEADKTGFPTKQEVWQRDYRVFPKEDLKIDKGARFIEGKPIDVFFLGAHEGRFIKDFPTQAEAEAAKAAYAPYVLMAKKSGKVVKQVDTEADGINLARDLYKAQHPTVKREDKTPELRSIVREGQDYRGGRDIGDNEFKDAFGFRGVQFGNWTDQRDRQQSLNHAYDAMMDLADALGIPPQALSLNGELGLAFGARGSGRAAAHYEPTQIVINLTKTSGAGAAAHEWAHALDDYFGRIWGILKGKKAPFVSHGVSAKTGMRPEMVQAFKEVMGAIHNRLQTNEEMLQAAQADIEKSAKYIGSWLKRLRTELKDAERDGSGFDALASGIQNAAGDAHAEIQVLFGYMREKDGRLPSKEVRDALEHNLDWRRRYYARLNQAMSGEARPGKLKSSFSKLSAAKGPYWAREHELFARAFESFILDKLEGQGRRSDYLVHPGKQALEETDPDYPYPAGAERKNINAAFEKFVAAMQTRETEKGTALYSRRAAGSFGQAEGLFEKPDVPVTVLRGDELTGAHGLLRAAAIKKLRSLKPEDLHNEDTGWDLTVARQDWSKLAKDKGQSTAGLQAIGGIEELVKHAVLAETHRDQQHQNPSVSAVHRLYAPLELGGQLYRVKLTVKDYSITMGGEKRNLHALQAIEIESPAGNPLAHETHEAPKPPAQPTGQTSSIADLLRGAVRDSDGQPFTPQDSGVRHSYLGREATLADHSALGEAIALSHKGVSREEVRQKTGWHLGKDEQWRFEISDKNAKLKPGWQDAKRLGDAFDHQALYANYPGLELIKFGIKDLDRGIAAEAYPKSGHIFLSDKIEESYARSVLLHEVQHIVRDDRALRDGRLGTLPFRAEGCAGALQQGIPNAGEAVGRHDRSPLRLDQEGDAGEDASREVFDTGAARSPLEGGCESPRREVP